jgi:arsenate reductase-like glutaredoxin family protein
MDGIDKEDVVCCFCGKRIKYYQALSLSIRSLSDEDEVQNMFAHRLCLRNNIINTIPIHPNFEPEK